MPLVRTDRGDANVRRRSARSWLRLAPLLAAALASAVFVACADDGGGDGDTDITSTATITLPTETVTATATEPPATSTSTPDATGTPGEDDGEGPAAPTNVRLSGPRPDTGETVTPGEGETGRVTVEWDYEDDGISGFRVYQRECDGTVVAEPIEAGADERQYGPLQPCRPGGDVGVSAVDASGESEIVWSQE